MKVFQKHKQAILAFIIVLACVIIIFLLPKIFEGHYVSSASLLFSQATTTPKVFQINKIASHIKTPNPVKGVYMTSWTASGDKLRSPLVELVEDTELNSVVIDIKDYSGRIVFPVSNPTLKSYGSEQVRVPDIENFIESLHQKGIYVIGRVAVFQDAYFVKYRPDLAVKNKSGSQTWKDHKGISWIDAGSREYWDYIILIARQAHDIGFDEINFDYIRYPSDGDLHDISYPWTKDRKKTEVLKEFFAYLHEYLHGIVISADFFGMTTTAKDDMGIGQMLENAMPYFDFVDPMVYPSHYAPHFDGFTEPEAHPYEVVKFAMQSAVDRAIAASSTPSKLRPWLQDFGLRQNYGPEEVKGEIKATYDDGLNSWLLWSASNKYTAGGLESK